MPNTLPAALAHYTLHRHTLARDGSDEMAVVRIALVPFP